MGTLGPLFQPPPNRYLDLQLVADKISVGSATAFRDDDLVVHVRSGDVFVGNGAHPGYGQPPLAYYRRIISSREWNKIHLVFEDCGNPVISPLVQFVESLGIPLIRHSGSLESDLSVLLSARTLVAGIGTFMSGVVSISKNVKTIYGFERYANWGNVDLNVIMVSDSKRDYVGSILTNNWRNTPEQRELMLTYPDENLAFKGH